MLTKDCIPDSKKEKKKNDKNNFKPRLNMISRLHLLFCQIKENKEIIHQFIKGCKMTFKEGLISKIREN